MRYVDRPNEGRTLYEMGASYSSSEPDPETAWQKEWDGNGGPPWWDFSRPRDLADRRRRQRDERRQAAGLRVRRRTAVRSVPQPRPWLVTELESGSTFRAPTREAADVAVASYEAFCESQGKRPAACKVERVPEPDTLVGVLV